MKMPAADRRRLTLVGPATHLAIDLGGDDCPLLPAAPLANQMLMMISVSPGSLP
jgi:hypothetical protein